MRSRLLGHFQNFLHREVTLLGGWRPDVVGFICLQNNTKQKQLQTAKTEKQRTTNETELSSISPWPHAWSVCLHHCTQPQSGRPSSWPCASHGTRSLLDWQSAPSLSVPPLHETQQILYRVFFTKMTTKRS